MKRQHVPLLITAAADKKCMFCGNKRHPRKFCPARNVTCFKCSKGGHFSKVCRSKLPFCRNDTTANAIIMEISANVAHSKVNIPVFVNGSKANALFDTGSTLESLKQRPLKTAETQFGSFRQLCRLSSKMLHFQRNRRMLR